MTPSKTLRAGVHGLHLGCGRNLLQRWENLDKVPPADVIRDLETCGFEPLPFEDNSFDIIVSSHTLEHIHNILPLMEELYRIAKPNALMIHQVPHYHHDVAVEDPTHVRFFSIGSFQYFSQAAYQVTDYNYKANWENTEVLIRIDGSRVRSTGVPVHVAINHLNNIVEELVFFSRAVKDKPHSEWRPIIRIDQMPEFRSILHDIPEDYLA